MKALTMVGSGERQPLQRAPRNALPTAGPGGQTANEHRGPDGASLDELQLPTTTQTDQPRFTRVRPLSDCSVLFNLPGTEGLGGRLRDSLSTNSGNILAGKFPSSETRIEIHESVRDRHAFVVASMGAPVNESLVNSMLIVQALKLADAKRITLVLPYFPYARQDRKVDERPPISAKAVADIFKTMGAHQIVTVDLHATQVEGFFDGPFENLSGLNQIVPHVIAEEGGDLVVVSPDAGGAKRAEIFARQVERLSDTFAPLVVMSKFRPGPAASPIVTLSAGPEILSEKTCVLVDDMIDTGGSIVAAATALKEKGAARVIVCATHGVFSDSAVERLAGARLSDGRSVVDKIYVTDTLVYEGPTSDILRVVSIAPLLAEAISRLDQPMGTLRTLNDRTDLGDLLPVAA